MRAQSPCPHKKARGQCYHCRIEKIRKLTPDRFVCQSCQQAKASPYGDRCYPCAAAVRSGNQVGRRRYVPRTLIPSPPPEAPTSYTGRWLFLQALSPEQLEMVLQYEIEKASSASSVHRQDPR